MSKKKIEQGEKIFFYSNTEVLADETPGMGAYNPHLSVDKVHKDKKTRKFWIDKHAKE